MSQIYEEGEKNYYRLYIGGVYVGVLNRIPSINFSNNNNGTPVPQLVEGIQKVVASGIDLLKFIPFMNVALGETYKKSSKASQDIIDSLMKVNGVSVMGGGVYSRRYYQDNNHLSFTFETVIRANEYVEALGVLNRYVYPTFIGDQVKDVAMMFLSALQPSMLKNWLDKNGDISFTDSTLGAILHTMESEVSVAGLKQIVDDTKTDVKNGIIAYAVTALKDSGFSINPSVDLQNQQSLRLAKFTGTLIEDKVLQNKKGSDIVKGVQSKGTENPFTTVQDALKKGGQDNFLASSALEVVKWYDKLSKVQQLPQTIMAEFFGMSALHCPEKIGLDEIYVKEVGQNGSETPITLDKFIPFPIKSLDTLDSGNRFCIEDFSVSPHETIDCSNGNPLIYKISITVSTTQKITTSGLGGKF